MIPGRMCETSCSSFRISWESASILAFCSSIFFASASSSAASAGFADSGAGVWAEAAPSAETRVAQKNRRELHRVENLATGRFVWQAAFVALNR